MVSQYAVQIVDVHALDKTHDSIENAHAVTGMITCNGASIGQTHILAFHKSLYYGPKLDHSLIDPIQVSHYRIGFNDNPCNKTRDLSIDISKEVKICMHSFGTKVRFEILIPTNDELDNCYHIIISSILP